MSVPAWRHRLVLDHRIQSARRRPCTPLRPPRICNLCLPASAGVPYSPRSPRRDSLSRPERPLHGGPRHPGAWDEPRTVVRPSREGPRRRSYAVAGGRSGRCSLSTLRGYLPLFGGRARPSWETPGSSVPMLHKKIALNGGCLYQLFTPLAFFVACKPL